MPYIGAGGQQFMSSVLAKASMPGGYTRTVPRTTNITRTATPAAGGVNAATLAAIQRAKALYAPGGGFGKGVETGLERGRVKAMASGMQGLVSAGLAGTTMAGGLGKKYEEEVGAPTRARVEEQRAQALSGIEMAQAGMGFQAGQAGAQRSLQLYLAQLQADLQRQEMMRRDRPMAVTPQAGGYAQQFPSIYNQEETVVPNWMGGDRISGLSPAASMFQRRIGSEERFDIDFGPGTLAG
ncbi:hypothetical protein KAR91_43850 [Candidatus Pacearchaeota archaeon]|nr:hypothetical protein [Candidatus Pacearchaeota archaeon]